MMNNVDLILDAAFQDYNNGNLSDAERKVQEALILSPTHGDALYLLGLIAYKKGVYVQAIDILNLVIKLYPEYQNYQLTLAEVYQNNGELDKAKELFLKAPENPLAMAQVGWIEMRQNNFKKAKKIFEKIIKNNSIAEAYWGMAELYKGKKYLEFLKKAYDIKAIPGLTKELALYYIKAKKYHLAKSYIKLLPNDKLLKALLFRSQKKYQEALRLLKELTQENVYLWKNWLTLGETAEMANDIVLAEEAYRRVLSLDKNLEACKALARILMKQGRISEALDEYQKLARENPQDKETLLAVATVLEENNEFVEALGLYFNLISLGQKGLSVTIKNLIQKLYQLDPETAKRFADGWVKNFPKNKIAEALLKSLKLLLVGIFFWGNLVLAQENSSESDWDLLWQSKTASYGDPLSQYELGKIYEEGRVVPKNLAKAIDYYQQSAKQNHLPSALQLARLFSTKGPAFNEKKSLEWYTYAAKQGDVQAQIYLFHYYDEKVPPDKKEAFYWLTTYLKQLYPNEEDFSKVSPDYERFIKEDK